MVLRQHLAALAVFISAAILVNVAGAQQAGPGPSFPAIPLLAEEDQPDVNDDRPFATDEDDDFADDDQDDRDDMIPQIVQEVFLGTSIYPQEKGELQFDSGYFQGNEWLNDAQVPFEIEYGITDRFQVSFECPLDVASPEDEFERGVNAIEMGVYYNFYNNPHIRRAFGVGYDIEVATELDDEGNRLWVHSPYVVGYQEFGPVALNVTGRLEVGNTQEETEVAGNVAFSAFTEMGNWVPMLELGLQWEEEKKPIVLAPGLFWKPSRGMQLGASLPIGLNDDAPHIGVFALMVLEFGGNDD
ncbi:hypothetical protein AB1L30_22755 [Bremerella sp. JC817]|uniref:hypothetical protein n=1 Tax=Bremerella sp. JC817 TaxID=3231756 RepID=UPI003458A14D